MLPVEYHEYFGLIGVDIMSDLVDFRWGFDKNFGHISKVRVNSLGTEWKLCISISFSKFEYIGILKRVCFVVSIRDKFQKERVWTNI